MARDMAPEVDGIITRTGDNSSPVDLAKINTLHELLALALDDFEKVLGNDRYRVNMNVAHLPRGSRCSVCLAGALIANTLGRNPEEEVWLDDEAFSREVVNRLEAIDHLRLGQIRFAKKLLNGGDFEDQPGAKLESEWLEVMWEVGRASGAEEGARLLSKLRLMQAELKEAGL